jgi:hypothetical protein
MTNPQPAQPESATPDFGERVYERFTNATGGSISARIIHSANHEYTATLQSELDAMRRRAEAADDYIKELEDRIRAVRKALDAEPAEKPAMTLEEHTQHVQRFLNEMWSIMGDPVENFKGTVAEMCETLLRLAREQREREYVSAQAVREAVAAAAEAKRT